MPFVFRIIILLAFIFVTEFYFYRKLFKSLQQVFPKLSARKIKAGIRTAVIVLNIYPLLAVGYWIYILTVNQTNAAPPQNSLFDYLFVYPFWISMLIVLQSIVIILPVDLIKLITYPFWKKLREKFRRRYAVLFLFVIAVFSLYVPARIIYDYNTVLVRETTFTKSNLKSELEGFKIAVISDIQADWYTDADRLGNFISKVNSANPDLVLIAGDVITNSPLYIDKAAEYLGKIKSKYGVYTCIGDHDNWAYRDDNEKSVREITEALKKQNVFMIDNDKKRIDVNGASIGITFVTNTYVERISDKVLDSLADGGFQNDLKIFLTHQPRQYLIDKAIKYEYDLFLAGHTHGGQITLFFPFYNLTPTLIETNYIRGDFRFGDMMMIVTPGLGMSLAPIRYNSTPEVTILTIKSND